VASILLALAADAWWDRHQAAQLEADVLAALSLEVAANQDALRRDQETTREDLGRLVSFMESKPEDLAAVSPDSVGLWARALSLPTTFDPQVGAASLLLEAAVLSRDGVAARALLSEWLTRVSDAAEEKEGVRLRTREVQERLAPYATRATRGREGISPRIASLGPGVLTELRADSALVAAVLLKTTAQEIYLRNLMNVGRLLDSLAVEIGVQ